MKKPISPAPYTVAAMVTPAPMKAATKAISSAVHPIRNLKHFAHPPKRSK